MEACRDLDKSYHPRNVSFHQVLCINHAHSFRTIERSCQAQITVNLLLACCQRLLTVYAHSMDQIPPHDIRQ